MAPVNTNAGNHVLLLGASGTAGRATAAALVADGHRVTAVLRPGRTVPGVEHLIADDIVAAACEVIANGCDAVVTCLASRTGTPADARAIDRDANVAVVRAAQNANLDHVTLLSALCVQKPRLAFQREKKATEETLRASGLRHSIVRPTAFFKSLSGQVERVRAGKPFLLFGDGQLTACKPISDRDLGRFIAQTLTDPELWNRTLPVGGPGPALSPRDMGDMLFRLTGQRPRYRSVPVGLMPLAARALSTVGRLSPRIAEKAELAQIGHYYATESMLVWDAERGAYDADATPEFGTDRLEDHFRAMLDGSVTVDLREHKVF